MKIKITRLPDINKWEHLPTGYVNYGRFGVTYNNHFYVLPIQSSHPGNTQTGAYWALSVSKDILYFSPRGATLGFEEFVDEVIQKGWIHEIAKIAGVKFI